tara:strand:- start:517 stop:771 length:255 start_codon:yes stop_codon:yes gene_type:complete
MNRTKRIGNILQKNLTNFSINVIDNSHLHKGHNNFNGLFETHIAILLKKKTKNKINRLEIHKMINSLLKDEFDKGLHSLEIKIN